MIALDPETTNAGAMERVMLLETYTPAKTGSYVRDESLKAMRLMRQVIENRLKAPARYGARDAEDETDIIKLGNQFANFGDYPDLPAALKNNLQDTLRLANAPNDPRQGVYAQFVQDAITAATEAMSPLSAVDHAATGWRTAMRHSPGANFRIIATLQGNTFFSTSPVPSMPPRRRAKHK